MGLTFNTAIDSFMNSAGVRFADELTEQHVTPLRAVHSRKQGNSPRTIPTSADPGLTWFGGSTSTPRSLWRRRGQHSRRRSSKYTAEQDDGILQMAHRPVSPHGIRGLAERGDAEARSGCSCAGPNWACCKASSGSSGAMKTGAKSRRGGAGYSGSGGSAGKTQAMEGATRQHQARAWNP